MLQTIQPCRSHFAFGIPTSTSRFAAHRFDHSFCFFSTSCRPKNGFIRQKALRIRAFSSGTDLKEERDNSSRMTIAPGISIANRKLIVCGKTILSKVPENIILTPDSQTGFGNGAFIGATSSESRSKLVFPIGVLEDLRFMCCFRFKLWWMMQRMGTFGKDVPFETQFLLLESREGSPLSGEMNYGTDDNKIYIVFLPLLDGSFRTSLQGNQKNELEMCLESGDPTIQTSSSMNAVYVRAGTDPFQVIKEAVRAVETHMGTFSHREEKKMPGMLDWFGWCTWDAFYTDVSAEAVIEGLESFTAGGVPPRFLIIDDGWQSVEVDQKQNLDVVITSGTQLASRLVHIKENHKFQKDGKVGERVNEPALGLQLIVKEAKEKYHLKYVYVWHAITGYWGGVHPDMEQFESVITYPSPSPGIIENQPDFAADSLIVNGLGLVNPKRAFHFYNEMHSYLASAGVDGVKVDVQSILETMGSGHGGRVKLTSQYHQALEESIACNFPDNGCIACMSHNTDSLFCSKQTAVVRASDDFWPKDPASHTIHIASVAYNSIFLGEFMQPDWDMFHSLHPAAEYHAAARAVGGCGVYVSDKPGNHNFELLKKLVLPDGSILRAQLPGRPTCDSLFSDPTRDQSSLLKIWNMNKYTGVIGAFNCQGAAWCIVDKVAKIHDKNPKAITGSIHARDVPLLKDIAGSGWNHEIVVYGHRNEELVRLPRSAALPITLEVLNFEIFTIVPLKNLTSGLFFAPIGLLKMYNSGGAIQSLEYQNLAKPNNESANCIEPNDTSSIATVEMKVKGCGTFGSYSSVKPKCCSLEASPVDFNYNCENGLLTVELPLPKEGQLWNLRIEF